MKHLFTTLFFLLILCYNLVWAAQEPEKIRETTGLSIEMFSLFMGVQQKLSPTEAQTHWQHFEKFAEKLGSKKDRFPSEKAFVRHVFYKVHRRLLKKYTKYSNLYDLFEDGRYNCATGTAIYAFLFDAYGLDYQIHETPYHVFMMVYTDQHTDSVLIESTNPYGFINDHQEMAVALDSYQQVPGDVENDTFGYVTMRDNISLQQLAGLNYFNEAISRYNNRELGKALQYLNQANYLYPAERMVVFRKMIFETAESLGYRQRKS